MRIKSLRFLFQDAFKRLTGPLTLAWGHAMDGGIGPPNPGTKQVPTYLPLDLTPPPPRARAGHVHARVAQAPPVYMHELCRLPPMHSNP